MATPYSDVNLLINTLFKEVSRILDSQFSGMYINGSLALKDFNPCRSDIDLVVVTSNSLGQHTLEQLRKIHEDIANSSMTFAKRYECVHLPEDSLREYYPANKYPCLHVGGAFYEDGFGFIEKHILREHGLTIHGKSPTSITNPVSSQELKDAAISSLENWWLPKAKEPSTLYDEYQAFAVLTMCRALYTLDNADVVSKSVAARYALNKLDKEWHDLIEKALNWCIGHEFNELKKTVRLIMYVSNIAKIESKS